MMKAEQKIAISRVSGLILVNAMIFQEILAEGNKQIISLQSILEKKNSQNEFCSHWKFIIDEINYFPIFNIAQKILSNLTSGKDLVDVVNGLAKTAQQIVSKRASLRHDLMGRIYHKLLVDKKYLGTYYTSIPSATLLLKLALQPTKWETKWNDLEEIKQFRLADLACGTGTLLMAAADAIVDNYISESSNSGISLDINRLHNDLAEEVIFGYDVLPSAIQLTASTISLRAPNIAFKKMNLFSLPLGGPDHKLGSIELIRGNDVSMPTDLFSSPSTSRQIMGRTIKEIHIAPLPKLDLCVMNPPFTRSVGGNLLFGSLPEKERKESQKILKDLIKKTNASANISAGLGSVFIAVADPFIKERGRIALVLPKTFLSGASWSKSRDLLSKKYKVEYIIASQDPHRWNFSESTKLSEILLVAQKVDSNSHDDSRVIALNLLINPNTHFEALAIMHSLINDNPPDLIKNQGALDISIGKKKVGEAISLSWQDLKSKSHWLLPNAFAQSDLLRASYHLQNSKLWFPNNHKLRKLPLCPLNKLGDLGPDRRGVHDSFGLSKIATSYPAFWGHNAKETYTINQKPNCHLSPLSQPKTGQINPIREAGHLWAGAGKLLITERFRLNTHRILAVRVSKPVLSNVWWPFSSNNKRQGEKIEKILSLWLNSTLGFMLLLANREDTEGPWIGFKKGLLLELPVLDYYSLTETQISKLVFSYERISKMTFGSFPLIADDLARKEIDKSICSILRIPDLAIFREMLAREPMISLKRL